MLLMRLRACCSPSMLDLLLCRRVASLLSSSISRGNAITLSKGLYQKGIRDLKDLALEAKHRRSGEMLTLAVVSRYSTHAHLLRQWLTQGGIRSGQGCTHRHSAAVADGIQPGRRTHRRLLRGRAVEHGFGG